MSLPRPFTLIRDIDRTGISGTGEVAQGVEFEDGVVAIRWKGRWPTSVVFHDHGLRSVKAVHGHNGDTRINFDPEEALTPTEIKTRVCEYLLSLNRDENTGRPLDHPFIPPTAIDWIGNGVTAEILRPR